MRLLVSEIQSWRPQVYPPNAGRAFLLNVKHARNTHFLRFLVLRHLPGGQDIQPAPG
jgi:hypothetical protein